METENKELVALAKTLPGYQEDDDKAPCDNGGRGYIGWSPHGDYLWVKKDRARTHPNAHDIVLSHFLHQHM